MRLRGTREPGASGERVLVELEEADDAGLRAHDPHGTVPPGPPGAPAGTAAPRRRRPALWWVGAAVLVALVVVVAVANVTEARRESDRRAAFAGLTWVLPPIDGPLQEAWRASATGVVAVTPRVVVLQDGAGGLRGVDVITGVEAWALDFAESGYCGSTSGSWPYDLEPEEGGDPVLLCQSPSEVAADTGAWQDVAFRTIDARTGELLAELSADGALITAALADDDLVLVRTRPDDTLVVDRTDLRTGERQWRYEGEPGSDDSPTAGSVRIEVTDTAVLVEGTHGLALAVDTGEVLPADQVPALDDGPDTRVELEDGGAIEWRYDRAGGSGSGQVVDGDGSVRFTFDGSPVWPFATDAAPAVLVVQRWSADGSDNTMRALDIRTGEELWSEPGGWGTTGLLELDDRLLTASGVARMVDERSGRELWQIPLDASVTLYSPVTDGDVVVLPIRDDGQQLVAVDLDGGEERWRMPVPDGVIVLGAAATGVVLAITDTEVIAYRP